MDKGRLRKLWLDGDEKIPKIKEKCKPQKGNIESVNNVMEARIGKGNLHKYSLHKHKLLDVSVQERYIELHLYKLDFCRFLLFPAFNSPHYFIPFLIFAQLCLAWKWISR